MAFNFAYRVLGSEPDAAEAVQRASAEVGHRPPDGERQFALRLLAATRRACHDLAPSRRRPPPASSEGPEAAIAAAGMRLPIRQREALALRELGRLSYVEIAMVMETGQNAVAQLISRARINLSDELRGTVLASIAAPSPACERALPLIAMRDDGQLEPDSTDAAWLDTHLSACERCRLGIGAIQDAAASYGSWAPIAVPAGLGPVAPPPGGDVATASAPVRERRRLWPLRRPAFAAGLASLLLLAGLAMVSLGDDATAPPLDPAADAAPPASAALPGVGGRSGAREGARRQRKTRAKEATEPVQVAADTGTVASPVPAPITTDGSSSPPASRPKNPPSGEGAVEPTKEAPASKPRPQPKPAQTTAAAPPPPAPAPVPVAEEFPPVAEEPVDEPPRGKDPPGKAVGRPPK